MSDTLTEAAAHIRHFLEANARLAEATQAGVAITPELVAHTLEWETTLEVMRERDEAQAAIAELNARLEERAQDHIKASARDVAEIQRLRVELDALKRRIVKPLRWEEWPKLNFEQLHAEGVRCRYSIENPKLLRVYDEDGDIIYDRHEADSLDHAKRIAEDLHRESVLALLEKEA